MKQRIYVVKKNAYQVESKSLLTEIKEGLQIKTLNNITKYNIYDVFHADQKDIDLLCEHVIAEVVTDDIVFDINLENKNYIAYETLPGQFDQRADSAMQCLSLLNKKDNVEIRCGTLLVLDGDITHKQKDAIINLVMNPIESRIKDLNVLTIDKVEEIEEEYAVDGFLHKTTNELEQYRKDEAFAMTLEDLKSIQEYFKEENRNPNITELKVLDTYWSDHCRHTTFETELKNIQIKEGLLKSRIEQSLKQYLNLREDIHHNKKVMTLMDMATIAAKKLRKEGKLNDLEISNEINACSIEIEVDEDGKKEPWLLMFKNETHNHPTEIEPFGGASTCIGGAIRDPLSGRSYVYQAMRISGAGDINANIEDTLANKLPQSKISKGAAQGYSSYGNQIGLATTYVKEIYHDGYIAKRMEVGAVVGAVKKEYVVREEPQQGDIVLLIGGATGRDGIGGATGSSKEHTEHSLTKSFSEVQKGNAPIERKIQRLFRNPNVTRLIKKSNDFGAGGVCVAIGELARGIDIDLDKVPTKYSGLSGCELAISESQERMAVVIRKEDVDVFTKLAFDENLTVSHVATITDNNRLKMSFHKKTIVDISRDFLDTNGVRGTQNVIVDSDVNHNPFIALDTEENLAQRIISNMSLANVASQQGLVEMFDASIGRLTVLMPYGGKYQLSENEGSVQKLPTQGFTTTCSMMSYGFHPYVSSISPYLGGSYSVVDALARITAMGGHYQKARLSCQEYFERLNQEDEKWGKPMQALLGNMDAQLAFETPSIGGKDSMSGTFKDLEVPPTLISFAITTQHMKDVVSSEFKQTNNYIYLAKHQPLEDYSPNYQQLKSNFHSIQVLNQNKKILSMSTIKDGGISASLCKMAFGNKIGFEIQSEEPMFDLQIGSILLETNEKLDDDNFKYLGKTNSSTMITINQESVDIEEALSSWKSTYQRLYPSVVDEELKAIHTPIYQSTEKPKARKKIDKPKVIIPVFPGTNCEYDSKKAFEKAGGDCEIVVFNNTSIDAIAKSITVLADKISSAQILMLSGGFSLGDEPDGSGKFIATILKNETINQAIQTLLKNDGLILGICNGFQALIKSGLLPYGNIEGLHKDSPTLFRNDINRHVSKVASTIVTSNKSPWLSRFNPKDKHQIVFSHGEGKFVVNEEEAKQLFENGQIATQYCDEKGIPSMNGTYNINGSYYAIEGITSEDGRILGKMGHSERYEDGLLQNIEGEKLQDIFTNGINYFK